MEGRDEPALHRQAGQKLITRTIENQLLLLIVFPVDGHTPQISMDQREQEKKKLKWLIHRHQ